MPSERQAHGRGEAISASGLVHGLAGELVAPDWPPLSDSEAAHLLGRWGIADAADARVVWRSPRPLSAAGLVRAGAHTVFVKRHDRRVRSVPALQAEHGFAAHLRAGGVAVPQVLATADGTTAIADGDRVYEIHDSAPGEDLYRDAASWTGFASRAHAWSAGTALGRLHRVAATYSAPPRPFGPLSDSCEVSGAADPLAALGVLVARRAGLAATLEPHPWRAEVGAVLGGALAHAARATRPLAAAWTHGDWHPSNLTWTRDGAPVAVLDLGLSNRTQPIRDVAIAIERACVSWLEASPVGDLAAVAALLDGYASVRAPDLDEWAALVALVPVVHVEFALSEVEYYGAVLGSPERAAVAYRDYLIGHARWWEGPAGRALLERLRERARSVA